jgi:hypothetical protein
MSDISRYGLAQLADADLVTGLAHLVARSNQVTAELLAHLGEVDARRLYLPAACSSIYSYCVRVLGLSKDAAYRRIHAARAARRYPLIYELVAAGKLHLAGITLLAPHLSPENHRELLSAALCLSKRDVERLIAHRFPTADPPSFVRRCPCSLPGMEASVTPPASAPSATRGGMSSLVCPHTESARAELAPGQVMGEVPQEDALGSRPASYRVQFIAGQDVHDKLVAAQDLLGDSVPQGDLARVFERALDALLRDLRRSKHGTERPRKEGRRRAAPELSPAQPDHAVDLVAGKVADAGERAPAARREAPVGQRDPPAAADAASAVSPDMALGNQVRDARRGSTGVQSGVGVRAHPVNETG